MVLSKHRAHGLLCMLSRKYIHGVPHSCRVESQHWIFALPRWEQWCFHTGRRTGSLVWNVSSWTGYDHELVLLPHFRRCECCERWHVLGHLWRAMQCLVSKWRGSVRVGFFLSIHHWPVLCQEPNPFVWPQHSCVACACSSHFMTSFWKTQTQREKISPRSTLVWWQMSMATEKARCLTFFLEFIDWQVWTKLRGPVFKIRTCERSQVTPSQLLYLRVKTCKGSKAFGDFDLRALPKPRSTFFRNSESLFWLASARKSIRKSFKKLAVVSLGSVLLWGQ